ncbi:MAG: flagellar hook protein FlgE [Gammaproteobacteria bacterium]|nr:flagellar hook protein FlgE [Gammaproteobacteria bacterium]
MSFNSALSGLSAAQTQLDVISNNVANAETYGFKESRAEFSDVYATNIFSANRTAVGAGVAITDVAQQFSQGNLAFTDNAFDLSITGTGFFVLSKSVTDADRVFSRAGNFRVDESGYVSTNDNHFLRVFPCDADSGEVSALGGSSLIPLQLPTTMGQPSATSQVELGLNFDASATGKELDSFDPTDSSSYNHATAINIYDSLGATHTLTTYYVKDDDNLNTWAVFTAIDGTLTDQVGGTAVAATNALTGAANPTAGSLYGVLTFNNDGTFNAETPTPLQTTLTPATGGAASTITIDFANNAPTQFASAFSVNVLSQDGTTTGQLTGVDIDEKGTVRANYTNGTTTALGVIAMAQFNNDQGLRQKGGTKWEEKVDSGEARYGQAGSSNFGVIRSGSLEASNVDLTEQLVKLITAQRYFQSNSKSISTASEAHQSIIQLR